MSQENVEPTRAVRIPLVPETRRHRSVDERIVVRFPALARPLRAAWWRLPRHSRLRRVILVRLVRRAYAAANRRDFDLLLTNLDASIEFRAEGITRPPDFDALFHGHHGYREAWRVLLEAFEDARLDPQELLDLGDRWLVTVDFNGHGAGSGVPFNQQLFQVFTSRRGLIVRQDDFLDHAEALKSLGLPE
jgi:ketosteroid isomerase-like protein